MAKCPAIQNSSNVKISAAFQTDFTTPDYTGQTELSARTADPSQGNVEFQSSGAIGQVAPVDVAAVSTTVEKSITLNNMPVQLNMLAQLAFGAPTVNDAPANLVSIGFRGSQNVRLTAAADKLSFEQSANGTDYTEIFNVALPATIAAVITAVNAQDGWFANLLYGAGTANWSWEGTMPLQEITLVPASPVTGTSAKIRVFTPLKQCPEYWTILYKMFAGNTALESYRADIGAQAIGFNIAMPRGGFSTVEIPYIAYKNISVDKADVPNPPAPMDRRGQYRSAPELYRIFLAGQSFPEIAEVSAQMTLQNNPEKSWDTTQLATGVTKYDLQLQVNGFLSNALYTLITSAYQATNADDSSLPTIIAITHPQYADPVNAIPYMFGFIMPKAKVSQAPNMQVEEGALIPCNFAMQPVMPNSDEEDAVYFFTIS